MSIQKEHPAALPGADRVDCLTTKFDTSHHTTGVPPALVILAERLRLPLHIARLYAALAGWRDAA